MALRKYPVPKGYLRSVDGLFMGIASERNIDYGTLQDGLPGQEEDGEAAVEPLLVIRSMEGSVFVLDHRWFSLPEGRDLLRHLDTA
jgi:hypothetical protein